MACRYEEETYKQTGDIEQNCGCSTCPYKTLDDCCELTPNNLNIGSQNGTNTKNHKTNG